MKLEDFSYDLPETLIATRPPEKRGSTRLLVLDKKTGTIHDSWYQKLSDYLETGDVVVINNTRVIRARLLVETETGASRELLLLEKHGEQQDIHRLKAMYRRRLKPGMKLKLAEHLITVESVNDDGTAIISSSSDLLDLAEHYGSVPLPPYMHRQADSIDIERYQTVFAKDAGSVAAPTASLNLTDELLSQLKEKGILVTDLTLHVGLGTFMPIRTDDITQHVMHQEYFRVPLASIETIRQAKQTGRRVVAIGTTVTRTLEYIAPQLEGAAEDISGEADIFIYPGYDFQVVDAMLTNFHAPHSTVLMMAAAFAGWEQLRTAYEHAKKAGYAFLSYGDSMLIH